MPPEVYLKEAFQFALKGLFVYVLMAYKVAGVTNSRHRRPKLETSDSGAVTPSDSCFTSLN